MSTVWYSFFTTSPALFYHAHYTFLPHLFIKICSFIDKMGKVLLINCVLHNYITSRYCFITISFVWDFWNVLFSHPHIPFLPHLLHFFTTPFFIFQKNKVPQTLYFRGFQDFASFSAFLRFCLNF